MRENLETRQLFSCFKELVPTFVLDYSKALYLETTRCAFLFQKIFNNSNYSQFNHFRFL